MRRDPAATARAAFAMAGRAELMEGQRAAALNRGMAIVEKYKLDPDDFDIPGREGKPRQMSGKRPTFAIMDEFVFEHIIREEADRARRRMAEDLFRQRLRAEQVNIRTEAQVMGRDRIRIVRNDGC